MSASTRSSRLGGANGYRRPALDVLDELTDPGTSDVRAPRRTIDTQDTEGTRGTPDNLSTSDDLVHSDTRGTVGNSGNQRPSGYRDNSDDGVTPRTSDTEGTSGTPDNLSTSDDLVHSDTRGTVGNSGNQRPSGYRENSAADQGTPHVSGTSGTRTTPVASSGRGPKSTVEPRDHVKVARSLAAEMRDAVWFLSEHGRPRIQLGELFDEAVRTWLEATKAAHNNGRPFPGRGPLR
jgi:hypothetical protein